jgi:RNA polymerase sigma-70 factor (ECF subfamily)
MPHAAPGRNACILSRVTSRPPDSAPPRDDSAFEEAVKAELAAGDLDGAVTRILRGLGPELLGFMVSLTRDAAAAGDAFSELSIDVWRGLPGFEWRSSLRTWTYVLARRAVSRTRRGAAPRAPHIPLSQASVISKVAIEVRDASLARTEALHDAFADVRAQLDEDEQVILVLRVDRSMGWRDIARVIAEGDEEADVDRVAATLRKRFERIKTRIRELTQAAARRK